MTTHQATVPQKIADYFGIPRNPAWYDGRHPTIESTFVPGRGWRRYPIRKRISGNAVRQLRAEGVTHIAVKYGERVADFTIKEASK